MKGDIINPEPHVLDEIRRQWPEGTIAWVIKPPGHEGFDRWSARMVMHPGGPWNVVMLSPSLDSLRRLYLPVTAVRAEGFPANDPHIQEIWWDAAPG